MVQTVPGLMAAKGSPPPRASVGVTGSLPSPLHAVARTVGPEIAASVFRACDIRGIAYDQLSETSVRLIGQAIGSEALAVGISRLYVGYDGRLSSPALSTALIAGLRRSGCSVISLGLIPTPLLYFATHTTAIQSGVMLTASHNPSHYNGFKIVFNRDCLDQEQIQAIRQRITKSRLTSGQGELRHTDLNRHYIDGVCQRINLTRPMKIVLDCGNAVPAVIAPALFRRLGCEVAPLYCEIDGSFPNHHPDPTDPANLQDLVTAVREQNAELGIAFDGDGDRLGLVTNLGQQVQADRILMLFVEHLASHYQQRPVVFDVKCSKSLREMIEQSGMQPVMCRSGHSFMKQKMKQTNAPFGGEYTAHIFLKDRWYGFDDGLYTAARVVEILGQYPLTSAEVFARYRVPQSTPEIRLPVPEDSKFRLMQKILNLADFPDADCITIDGLRAEFAGGWGLVRASNTSAALLLRFEADNQRTLKQIQTRFKSLLRAADSSLQLKL